jgi:hypothetical protein
MEQFCGLLKPFIAELLTRSNPGAFFIDNFIGFFPEVFLIFKS